MRIARCMSPLVACVLCTGLAMARPADRGYDTPGPVLGSGVTRWIAPYVQQAEVLVGTRAVTTVTWYRPDGTILRTVQGTPQTGFVYSEDCKTAYGLNDSWALTLPPCTPDIEGYTAASPDSAVLIAQRSARGHSTFHIFVHGTKVGTIGPLLSFKGLDIEVSEDGAAALLYRANEQATTASVLVIGPDGKERFRADTGTSEVHQAYAAPGGAGVLLHSNKDAGNRFLYYTAKGLQQSQVVQYNGCFRGWVPDAQLALMETSREISRYRLINWETGKHYWDLPCPGVQMENILLTPTTVFFAVIEKYTGGPLGGESWHLRDGHPEYIQTIHAVSLEDGLPTAYWHASYPQRLDASRRGSFQRLGEALYFVTPRAFCTISLEDVQQRKHGWGAPPQP